MKGENSRNKKHKLAVKSHIVYFRVGFLIPRKMMKFEQGVHVFEKGFENFPFLPDSKTEISLKGLPEASLFVVDKTDVPFLYEEGSGSFSWEIDLKERDLGDGEAREITKNQLEELLSAGWLPEVNP